MMKRCLPLLLPVLLAAPVHAATLAEALYHWTGLTADVVGHGPHVTVQLPPTSPIPVFTALTQSTTRAGDQGWQLTQVTVPQPMPLRGGDILTAQSQAGTAWLGAHTVQAHGDYVGLALTHKTETARLDHATVSLDSTGGPTTIAIDLDGPHLDHAGPLLPRHTALRGHTTPNGAEALSAMIAGHPGAPVPLTIDQAALDIGPAHFTATGTVTLINPHSRDGELTVTAQHFDDLMRHLPMDPSAAAAYPILLILRQLGQKHGDHLTWPLTFSGRHVLVAGIDVGPLMGL